jgi:hypothetical protein
MIDEVELLSHVHALPNGESGSVIIFLISDALLSFCFKVDEHLICSQFPLT